MFRFRNCVRLFCKRQLHSNAEIVSNCKEIRNRNPRNLERLRIARKPCGYSLEKPGYSYWQRLVVNPSQRYVTAQIEHFENGPILTVSTQEWGLKKQLYRGEFFNAKSGSRQSVTDNLISSYICYCWKCLKNPWRQLRATPCISRKPK
ncbi:mitochondrial ribosomal protein L18 isoform X2 [Calliopsis andreniformis]|uniref:mitochondrial ribosomal protein L18 isoform X2 n=1 Tax=Calliopsis andreniformis TaxID=337506 RepID=UPI003FCD6377